MHHSTSRQAALLAMSLLLTPGHNRLTFKSKFSFSFQRECFRRSHTCQRYNWQILLVLCHSPWPVVPGTAAFLWTGLSLRLGSGLLTSALAVGLKRESISIHLFSTCKWFDEIRYGKMLELSLHNPWQKCEVFLPSSADSLPNDVWLGLCWMWSRLLQPNISLVHTDITYIPFCLCTHTQTASTMTNIAVLGRHKLASKVGAMEITMRLCNRLTTAFGWFKTKLPPDPFAEKPSRICKKRTPFRY